VRFGRTLFHPITSNTLSGMDISQATITEAELHAASRAGDERAAKTLVNRYGPRLLAYSKRRLGRYSAEAKDLVQDVCMAAQRSRFQARPGASYWSWLACIARRQAKRRVEAHARKIEKGQELPIRRQTTPRTAAWRDRVLDKIASSEEFGDVLAYAAAGHRDVEIAERLGISRDNARQKLCRGRQWLAAEEI
jgi:RNA polymerase sigma factor (sigma-70 family)